MEPKKTESTDKSVIGALLDVSGSMREKFPLLSVSDFEKNKEKVLSIIDIIADITS